MNTVKERFNRQATELEDKLSKKSYSTQFFLLKLKKNSFPLIINSPFSI